MSFAEHSSDTFSLSHVGGSTAPEIASDPGVGAVIVIGLVIVFAALAVIFFAMMVMERIFRPGSKAASVRAPFDGRIECIAAKGAVVPDEVVAVVCTTNGERMELLSPAAGIIRFLLHEGDSFQSKDVLFTVGRGESK